MLKLFEYREEELEEFPFSVGFFKEFGLYTPFVKLYSSVSGFVKDAFPSLSNVDFPRPGSRWPPLPWTGMVITVTEAVINGSQWPCNFWETIGKYSRARIVDKHLRSNHGINMREMDEVELMMLGMEQPWRILND